MLVCDYVYCFNLNDTAYPDAASTKIVTGFCNRQFVNRFDVTIPSTIQARWLLQDENNTFFIK